MPEVVVADEEVDFHAVVGQFAQFAEQAGVAAWHYGAVLVPEVEDVAEQIYGGGFVLDAVEEIDEAALLCALVAYGQAAEVRVGEEVYGFHGRGERWLEWYFGRIKVVL